MRKVASTDHRSTFYRASVEFVTRFVVKWREFRANKKYCDNSDLLRKTYVRLTQCSKPVKNRKKSGFFKIYSSRFLDGFERLSAEATFRTTAHTAKNKFKKTTTTITTKTNFKAVVIALRRE